MNEPEKIVLVLKSLAGAFLLLAVLFLLKLWGKTIPLPDIPLVNPDFVKTATWRSSYAEKTTAGEDTSDFDCYGCHDKKKPPQLRFDDKHNLIVPQEHSDVVMGHGRNNRNNLCFNCHDENNLEQFQTRDGRELKLADSTQLCGSCHGPTFRDWEAGAHGRKSGFWNKSLGAATRKDCVSCHDPHKPKFPGRQPAPPPHPLRPLPKPATAAAEGEH